jgi:prepilin peptidase CpaA
MTPIPSSPETALLLIGALPICAWVAWSDLTRMKIPNRAVLALIAVFLIAGPFVLPWSDYAVRWAHLAVVLAVGIGLTAFRLIGAGDAKFLAAMSLFIEARHATLVLMLTAAVLVAAYVAHRAARRSPLRARVPHWESWRREEFPMGIALGTALAVYLVLLSS